MRDCFAACLRLQNLGAVRHLVGYQLCRHGLTRTQARLSLTDFELKSTSVQTLSSVLHTIRLLVHLSLYWPLRLTSADKVWGSSFLPLEKLIFGDLRDWNWGLLCAKYVSYPWAMALLWGRSVCLSPSGSRNLVCKWEWVAGPFFVFFSFSPWVAINAIHFALW